MAAAAAAPLAGQTAAPPAALKERLRKGDICTGTFLALLAGGPAAQFLAAQGLDYFILDLEHYIFDEVLVREMMLGARQAGITSIIRVPEPTPVVTRWLDAGAGGILIPGVESPVDAAALVRFGRYAPEGERGTSMVNGHSSFGRVSDASKFLAERNRDILLLVMIESPKGMDNLDAILSVPGIDGAVFGTGDYAHAISLAGQMDDPKVWSVADKFAAACRAKGKLCSVPVRRPEHVARWIGAGVNMLSFVDLGLIGQGLQLNLDAVKKAKAERGAR